MYSLKDFKEIVKEKNKDREGMKKNIVFQLVNTEKNKDLLVNIPHRSFQDLSIIYRWIIEIHSQNIYSSIVDNSFAANLDLTESQLFSLALDNTREIFPPSLNQLDKIISTMLLNSDIHEETLDLEGINFNNIKQHCEAWVLSNSSGYYGAASMLYEDMLYTLSQQIDDDIFILPSSIHEVILTPASMGVLEKYEEMVVEINKTVVPPDEKLSDCVYYYSKKNRTISRVSNPREER